MSRSFFKIALSAGFIVSTFAAPQVKFEDNKAKQSGCGIQNGEEREEGDSWVDDCNSCRCTNGLPACTIQLCDVDPPCRDSQGNFREGGAGWTHVDGCNQCWCRNGLETCTKKICDSSCIDSQGNRRENGSTWTHADGCNHCWCTNGVAPCTKIFCGVEPITVKFEDNNAKKSGCGIQNGEERKEGDSWVNDCNTCHCTNGLPACTIELCNVDPPCRDSLGNFREAGSVWTHVDGCNQCRCRNGLETCTRIICDSSCIDSQGNRRENGSTWTHADGCNHCWCMNGVAPCTKIFCGVEPITALPNIKCVGCPEESENNDDIIAAARFAAASRFTASSLSGQACGAHSQVEVVNVKTQVVAGTNYILTLKLGEGCGQNLQKICQNIVVFKPLSFQCKSDDGCLELIRQEEISCRGVTEGGDVTSRSVDRVVTAANSRSGSQIVFSN